LNRTHLPGYSIWNLRLGVRNSNYRVNFYVKNLTNKLAFLGYEIGGYGAPTYDFVVNQPRTVGVTFSETF
jgi:iron complex outermembrane recepter protein